MDNSNLIQRIIDRSLLSLVNRPIFLQMQYDSTTILHRSQSPRRLGKWRTWWSRNRIEELKAFSIRTLSLSRWSHEAAESVAKWCATDFTDLLAESRGCWNRPVSKGRLYASLRISGLVYKVIRLRELKNTYIYIYAPPIVHTYCISDRKPGVYGHVPEPSATETTRYNLANTDVTSRVYTLETKEKNNSPFDVWTLLSLSPLFPFTTLIRITPPS